MKKGHFLSQHNSSLSLTARSHIPAPPAKANLPKISLSQGVMVFGFLSGGKILPFPHPSSPASLPASREMKHRIFCPRSLQLRPRKDTVPLEPKVALFQLP